MGEYKLKPLFYLLFVGSLSWGLIASALTLDVQPAQPKVHLKSSKGGPGGTLRAPWIRAEYAFTSNELVTIAAIYYEITNQEGAKVHADLNFDEAVEVGPGGITRVQIYLENLPPSKSTIYEVRVFVTGWTGSKGAPTEQLDISDSFRTR